MNSENLLIRFFKLFYTGDMPSYMISERIIVYVRWVLIATVAFILFRTPGIEKNAIYFVVTGIAIYNVILSIIFDYKPSPSLFKLIQYVAAFIDELLLIAVITMTKSVNNDIYPIIFFIIFGVSLRMDSRDSYIISIVNIFLLPAALYTLIPGNGASVKAALLGVASMVNLFSTRVLEVNKRRLESEIQKTDIIFSISNVINSVMELEPLLEITIYELVNKLNVVAGIIALFDTKKEMYSYVASSGNLDIIGGFVSHSMLDDPLMKRILHEKEYFMLPQHNNGAIYINDSWFESVQNESIILFPFSCSSTYNVVIGLFGRKNRIPFSSYYINLLKAVSSQVVIGVNRAFLYEDLLYNRALQRELLARIETAYDDERKKIAGEIHDMASGVMYELVNSIDNFNKETKNLSQASQQNIAHIKSLVINYHKQLRSFMSTLRPTVLEDFGIVHALRDLLGSFKQRHNINVEFVNDRDEYPLDYIQSDFLYKTVNEALINVVKHSHAGKVVVGLSLTKDSILLSISDNGKGFDVSERFKNRYGLLYIMERGKLLKGKVDVLSENNGGTTITVMLPVPGRIA